MIKFILLSWAMYILGVFAHLFIVKIPGTKRRDGATNKPFTFEEYWKTDQAPILGNICLALMLTIGWDQFVKVTPVVDGLNLLIFGLLGFAGNAVALAWLSKYTNVQNEMINVKSNTSDVMTDNHSADLAKVTERAAAVTGKANIADVKIEIKRDPEAQ